MPGICSSRRRPRRTSARRAAGRPGPSSSIVTWTCSPAVSARAVTRRRRPFARVVHQVAEHLLEVLAGAAKRQLGRRADLDRERLLGIDAAKRALEVAQHRQDVGARAEDRAGGDRPGARQMVIDLPAHQRDLPAHQLGERAVAAARLVDQHAERRLQAVGEVADVGARALDQRLVVIEQRVELGRERLDLGGEVALEARASRRRGWPPSAGPMRRSGSRPKRTCTSTAPSTPMNSTPSASEQQAVEVLPVQLDLAPVAGDRVQQARIRVRAA